MELAAKDARKSKEKCSGLKQESPERPGLSVHTHNRLPDLGTGRIRAIQGISFFEAECAVKLLQVAQRAVHGYLAGECGSVMRRCAAISGRMLPAQIAAKPMKKR